MCMLSQAQSSAAGIACPLPDIGTPAAAPAHPSLGGAQRAMDTVVSLFLLIVLSPLLLLIAVLLLLFIGHPVFFTQERPGLRGRPFRLIKFRSMSDRRGPDGELLPDAQRLGKLGKW